MQQIEPTAISLPQSKAVQILRTIPKKWHRDLRDFAACPMFCKKSDTRKLLALLLDAHPDFSEKQLNESKIHRAVFAPAAFSIEKLWRLSSDLKAVLEQFVAVRALQNDAPQSDFYRVQHFSQQENGSLFAAAVRDAEQSLAAAPASFHAMYQNWRLCQQQVGHWSNSNLTASGTRLVAEAETAFQQHAEAVQLVFESEKLLRQQFVQPQTTAVEPAPEPPPLLDLLRRAHGLCLDFSASDVAFSAVFEKFKKRSPQLGQVERDEIFTLFENYCIVRFNAGDPIFREKLAQLRDWRATNAADFPRQWQLSETNFLHQALTVGMAGRLDEMLFEIEMGSPRLPPDRRDEAENLARAFFHFFKNEPAATLRFLEKVNGQQLWIKPRMHSLRLRVLFELACKSRVFGDLDDEQYAFDQYFQRKEELLSLPRRESYVRLGDFVRRLTSLARRDERVSDDEKQAVLADLRAENPQPIGTDWLEKMIRQL